MPTVKLSLGQHVVVRGTPGRERVYYAVQRERPQGWPSTIRLPQDPDLRALGYGQPAFMAAVLRDAQSLAEALRRARRAEVAEAGPAGSLPALIDQWQRSEHFRRTIKPRTRDSYASYCRYITAWSASLGDPHVSRITPAMIRAWLESGVQGATTLRNSVRVLSIILSRAVEAGLIERNPVERLAKVKAAARPNRVAVDLWTAADVATYVDEAMAMGWIGGARLVQGLWDSMGRLYDAPRWRPEHLDPATRILAYTTSKSDDARVSMAVMSQRFVDLCQGCNTLFLIVRPDGVRPYAELRDDKLLAKDFARLRERVVAAGGRRLVLRHLRHSAQTDADAKGVPLAAARVSTTHTDQGTAIKHYIKANAEKALEIARLRGIA